MRRRCRAGSAEFSSAHSCTATGDRQPRELMTLGGDSVMSCQRGRCVAAVVVVMLIVSAVMMMMLSSRWLCWFVINGAKETRMKLFREVGKLLLRAQAADSMADR